MHHRTLAEIVSMASFLDKNDFLRDSAPDTSSKSVAARCAGLCNISEEGSKRVLKVLCMHVLPTVMTYLKRSSYLRGFRASEFTKNNMSIELGGDITCIDFLESFLYCPDPNCLIPRDLLGLLVRDFHPER